MEEKKRPEVSDFKPGLYLHYRGGMYTALALVTHHENRQLYVLYMSHTYGGLNVRPLLGVEGDKDGWLDEVEVEIAPNYTDKVPRFKFIGDLPSDTPIKDRVK